MRILAISVDCITAINRKLYEVIAQKGFEVHLLMPEKLNIAGRMVIAEPPIHKNIILHTMPLKGKNPRTYRFSGFKNLVRQVQPQAIYLNNDPVSLMGLITSYYTSKKNIQLTALTCENQPFDLKNAFKRKGLKSIPAALTKEILLRLVRKHVHHLFTINHQGLELFSNMGFPSVSITPLGFDSDIFFPNEKTRKKIRKALDYDGIIIAYFGRLAPEKGILLLLDALNKVLHYEWRFMVDRFERYSNPFASVVYSTIEESPLRHRTFFIDADHIEIADYMNAADIVVLPSFSTPGWVEQYGRVAPEAMACGKLVITSDSGELPWLVGEGGIVFQEKIVNELTEKLEHFLKNPEDISQQANKATARAKKLSIEVQAKNIIEVINQHFNQIHKTPINTLYEK